MSNFWPLPDSVRSSRLLTKRKSADRWRKRAPRCICDAHSQIQLHRIAAAPLLTYSDFLSGTVIEMPSRSLCLTLPLSCRDGLGSAARQLDGQRAGDLAAAAAPSQRGEQDHGGAVRHLGHVAAAQGRRLFPER